MAVSVTSIREKGSFMRKYAMPRRMLTLIGLLPVLWFNAAQAADTSLAAIKMELSGLVARGSAKTWRDRLAPDFKTGFGERGDGPAAKSEFIAKIRSDPQFREQFLQILKSDCAQDEFGVDVCPGSWTRCQEDDVECGSQMRLAIDRRSGKAKWKLLFYGAGD